jgi:2-polyprenyl-3-methyl-5-hydroxy-6-metoxy-1,4-benzoquinol methylase
MTAVQPGVCPLCGPDYPRVEVAKGPDFDHRTTGAQEFRFTRCTSCETLVLDPRPVDDQIAALYPPDYVSYSFDKLNPVVRTARDLVQRRKAAAMVPRVRAGGTIVDVGCGTGTLIRFMRARYGSRFRLLGWDYPGPHLSGLESAGVEVIAAPIEPAHVPHEVDLFILNQVVEHVPHPDRLLTMLRDALAPGGHLVIETPDTGSLDARWFAGRYWGGYHLPRHMVLFNQRNLRALVERCGFHVVESKHLASPAFWVQSLNHLLLESRMPRAAPLFVLGNTPLVAMFSAFDLLAAPFFGTSNQRLVVQRPV